MSPTTQRVTTIHAVRSIIVRASLIHTRPAPMCWTGASPLEPDRGPNLPRDDNEPAASTLAKCRGGRRAFQLLQASSASKWAEIDTRNQVRQASLIPARQRFGKHESGTEAAGASGR